MLLRALQNRGRATRQIVYLFSRVLTPSLSCVAARKRDLLYGA